jgi:hypothetical protein
MKYENGLTDIFFVIANEEGVSAEGILTLDENSNYYNSLTKEYDRLFTDSLSYANLADKSEFEIFNELENKAHVNGYELAIFDNYDLIERFVETFLD